MPSFPRLPFRFSFPWFKARKVSAPDAPPPATPPPAAPPPATPPPATPPPATPVTPPQIPSDSFRGLGNPRFAGSADLEAVLAGTSTLRTGSRGPGVQAIQQALADMGFPLHGGADGAFGEQSARAVRNFQAHARSAFPNVQVTSVVDAATLQALDTLAPAVGQRGQVGNIPRARYQGQDVRIIVIKDEHRTFKFDRSGALEAICGNAVGKQSTPTPVGLRKVTGFLDAAGTADLARRKGYPTTVYGPRLVDLSMLDGSRAGQELHGTNAPADLGLHVSNGCVRHHNVDLDRLFAGLRVGDKVALVNSARDLELPAPPRIA
jgi:peptidoglycan hydrolase-like protein with peptidoglycan-binding domain